MRNRKETRHALMHVKSKLIAEQKRKRACRAKAMNRKKLKPNPALEGERARFENFLCEQCDEVCDAAAGLYSSITGEPLEDVEVDGARVWDTVEAVFEFCRELGLEAPCAPFYEKCSLYDGDPAHYALCDEEGREPCWYRGVCPRTDSRHRCPYTSVPCINLMNMREISDYNNFTAHLSELAEGASAIVVFKEDDGTPAYCTAGGDCSFAGIVTEVVEYPLEGDDPAETYLSNKSFDVACEFVNGNGCYAVGIRKCRLLTQEEYEYDLSGKLLTGPVTVYELFERINSSKFRNANISFDGATRCFYSVIRNELLYDDEMPDDADGEWRELDTLWPNTDFTEGLRWIDTYGTAQINIMGENYNVYAEDSETVILTEEGRYHG